MKVYVAGPLGPLDQDARMPNVRAAIDAGVALMRAGHTPFVPHLMHYFEGRPGCESLGYEDFMRVDFEWLDDCDCMLRLPGVSPGADREKAFADGRAKPVFDTLEEVLAWGDW